jgi:hypothetical protein
VIVWLNGTHGVGKTTTSALVQHLIPGSRIFDAEKVGETLMDVRPSLPDLGNFQHWPPWRPLVVETANRILEYTGGVLVMPMTVLVEAYWREISDGLAAHGIPVRHVVLHADQESLRARIDGDRELGPSVFRHRYVETYLTAFEEWLAAEAEVVDTTRLTPAEVARRVADVAHA